MGSIPVVMGTPPLVQPFVLPPTDLVRTLLAFPRAPERERGTGHAHADTIVPGWCAAVFRTPRRVRRSREGSPWRQRGAGSDEESRSQKV